jgi:hypothetical protein
MEQSSESLLSSSSGGRFVGIGSPNGVLTVPVQSGSTAQPLGYPSSDAGLCCDAAPKVYPASTGASLDVGRCCPQDHTTWWNAEVTNLVYSNNGVLLGLSPSAVEKIKAKFNGAPLYVTIRDPCCSCGCGCCNCCCPCCCCNCDCKLHSRDTTAVKGIWFGNRHGPSPSCPSCCTYFCQCLSVWCNNCGQPVMSIRPDEVSLAIVSPMVVSSLYQQAIAAAGGSATTLVVSEPYSASRMTRQ